MDASGRYFLWAKEEEDEEVAEGPDSVGISWSLVSRGQRLHFIRELLLRIRRDARTAAWRRARRRDCCFFVFR